MTQPPRGTLSVQTQPSLILKAHHWALSLPPPSPRQPQILRGHRLLKGARAHPHVACRLHFVSYKTTSKGMKMLL